MWRAFWLAVALAAAPATAAAEPVAVRVVWDGNDSIGGVLVNRVRGLLAASADKREVTEVRPGLAVRFLRHVRGDMLEEIALRERAAFAHVPVTIDGSPIGRTDPLAGLVQHQRQVQDGEGRVCVVGQRDDPHAPAHVRQVRHGVWV